jgi:hypothetical protein
MHPDSFDINMPRRGCDLLVLPFATHLMKCQISNLITNPFTWRTVSVLNVQNHSEFKSLYIIESTYTEFRLSLLEASVSVGVQ